MRYLRPLSVLGCVGLLLLLLSGCGTETPPEKSFEERCAELSCESGQCLELKAGEPACKPEGTLLTSPFKGSSHLEAGGQDVYTFRGSPEHAYDFRCTTGPLEWELALFNPSGRKVASGKAPANSGSSVVRFWASDEGLYTVVVSHPGGAPASYDYALSTVWPDPHGATRDTATRLTLGETEEGAIEVAADEDAFIWTGEARRIYRVSFWDSYGRLGVRVEDTTRRTMANSSNVSFPYERILHFTALEAGELLLQVREPVNFVMGSDYTVRVEALGLDDHHNQDTLATELQVPTVPSDGALDYPGDEDLLRFPATKDHIYRIRCTPRTLTSPCKLRLLNTHYPSEDVTAENELLYEARKDSTYFVRLSGAGTGAYTYSLEDVGTDDHGEGAASATVLPLGTSAPGILETPPDIDTFALPVEAGRVYRFTCAADEQLGRCSTQVSDPSGGMGGTNGDGTRPGADFKPKASGTCVAYVRGLQHATGHYTVGLVDLGVEDHGDHWGTATPLTLGVKATGRLETSDDRDAFSVALSAGTRYTLALTGAPAVPLLSMMLPDGRLVEVAAGTTAYTPSMSGTYAFFVRSAASWGTDTYELTLQ